MFRDVSDYFHKYPQRFDVTVFTSVPNDKRVRNDFRNTFKMGNIQKRQLNRL